MKNKKSLKKSKVQKKKTLKKTIKKKNISKSKATTKVRKKTKKAIFYGENKMMYLCNIFIICLCIFNIFKQRIVVCRYGSL